VSHSRKMGRRTNHPPDGAAWIWHTVELLASPAWCTQSINCRRLINFLEVEHLRHAGNENGSLLAPYGQLVGFGIGRRLIHASIAEAEQRGLVRVDRGGRRGVVMTEVNRFRLTYMWSRKKIGGFWDWTPPTDDWKQYSGGTRVGRNSARRCTVTVHESELVTVHQGELASSQAIENIDTGIVHEGELPSISWARGHLVSEQSEASVSVCCATMADREGKFQQ
jgi:hypothetical protein